MRILLSFIFLEFALIRCDQDVQQSVAKRTLLPCVEPAEDNAALQNLMGVGKPIENKVQLSGTCKQKSDETGAVQAGGGIRYDPSRTCYIMGKSDLVVSAKWKASEMPPPGFESCRTLTAFQAEYVHQRVDEDTYMILDPTMAPWLFTAPLSGCDVFVATSTTPDKRNKPIVIHSNLNSCGNKLQNLKRKGEQVDRLLKNNPDYQSYKLAARVFSRPGEPERPQAKLYLEKYQLYHPGIVLKFYDTWPPAIPQFFQFLCHYRTSLIKWRCILKGERDGSTQEVL